MAAVDNAVSPRRTAPAIQRPKLEELLTKKVYAKTSIIPAYSACWLLPSSSSPLLPLFFRLQFPLFVYLFLTPLSLCPHLTFWLPVFYLSWFPFVFPCGVWTPKEVLVNIRLVGLFVGWMCVQVCWGNVLWFKLAYVKAIVNSDVIHVSSPHPQCLFFPVALNKLLHFPVDCYSLAVHSHSKYNPVVTSLLVSPATAATFYPFTLQKQPHVATDDSSHTPALLLLLLFWDYFSTWAHPLDSLCSPAFVLQVCPPWESSQIPCP